MSKRARQRKNRVTKCRIQHIKDESREEMIGIRDKCGIKDPTPYEAVKEIIRIQKGAFIRAIDAKKINYGNV